MFQLPEGADEDKIQAEMKNGVLSIRVAKKAGFIENKKTNFYTINFFLKIKKNRF